MADNHPDSYHYTADLSSGDLADVLLCVLDAAREAFADKNIVEAVALPVSARPTKRKLEMVMGPKTGWNQDSYDSALLKLKTGDSISIFKNYGQKQLKLLWIIQLEELDDTLRRKALKASVTFSKYLIENLGLQSALCEWRGAGATCIPAPPLAFSRSQLMYVTNEALSECYESPEQFLAVWETTDAFENGYLLTRALEAVAGADLLQNIIDDQWALARAAYAGLTTYYFPELHDSEKEIYNSGQRTLRTVGYDEESQELELTCVLSEGQHINGWEIYNLWYPLTEGKLSDGSQLRSARVIFNSENHAEQEKRPLLDIGARVLFMDDVTGEDVEIF